MAVNYFGHKAWKKIFKNQQRNHSCSKSHRSVKVEAYEKSGNLYINNENELQCIPIYFVYCVLLCELNRCKAYCVVFYVPEYIHISLQPCVRHYTFQVETEETKSRNFQYGQLEFSKEMIVYWLFFSNFQSSFILYRWLNIRVPPGYRSSY